MQPSIQQIEVARAGIPRTLVLVGEDKSASWQYRVDWPCRALADHGFIGDWAYASAINGLMPLINAGRYNVLVTPRAHWATPEQGDDWLKVMHDHGLAWVYEIDDDGWSADIVQRQSKLYEQEWLKGEERLENDRLERIHLIQNADGVIVSSERLAEVARSYTNHPVFCVPNLIDVGWFDNRLSDAKRVVPPLTIGWSGGLRDEKDLINVGTAWTTIAERYPDVRFIVHGTTPTPLMNAVPGDRLLTINWSSLPDYPRALMNIDIACCAVEAGVGFNLAKTAIKWYEATLAGATCVVTPTLYGSEVRDGHDALVAETPEQWVGAISSLIDNPLRRKRLNRNARKRVVAEHSLTNGWVRWVEALAGSLAFYREMQSDSTEHAA